MLPIGMLMKEHRIIEKMLRQIEEAYHIAKLTSNINKIFLKTEIDFFQNFADKNHHAKEEEILFQALNQKQLLIEHHRILSNLILEHRTTRSMIWVLQDSRKKYERNEEKAIDEILTVMERLLTLYPKHIEKEEKHFFYPSMNYFNKQELEEMLVQFARYNKTIDYEKYVQMAEHFDHRTSIQSIQNR